MDGHSCEILRGDFLNDPERKGPFYCIKRLK